MGISLHHINLQAPLDLLLQLKAFYKELLDLREGPRPAFKNPGFWLYADAHPLIHFRVVADDACRLTTTTTMDHVAFACDDLPAMLARIQAMGLACRHSIVPRLPDDDPATELQQLFVTDPGGNLLELNFVVARSA